MTNTVSECTASKKPSKRGIIYLSTIPPYMNVAKLREIFSDFGKVGRIYLQLETKPPSVKKTKKHHAKRYCEGWLEFEKKIVAKRVAQTLNNTQVSSRKRSKHFDCLWNIKYLSHFKWTHLHERLAYEQAARQQKIRSEIQLAKRKSNVFSANLDKSKKKKMGVNREFEKISEKNGTEMDVEDGNESGDRKEFLKSLF